MVEISLSEPECRLATYVGKIRNKMSMETKVNKRRDPLQSDEDMNIQGMGAELAVAKYLNIYPELSPTKGELPQHDLLFGNMKIQVKRRDRTNLDLLVHSLREDVVYVLVYGQLPKFQIVGMISGSEVKTNGKWTNMVYGPCWLVEKSRLSEIKRERKGNE